MSTFKIKILGSGSALPTLHTHHSAQLLNIHEQFYLVDCGEGTQHRLLKAGIHPLKINAIFISHLHGDHIYGIFPLLSSLGLMGKRTPLKIFAPSPFGKMLDYFSTFFDDKLPFEVQYTEVDTREYKVIFENKVIEVYSVPLRHKLPTCGYFFKEKTPKLNVHKHKIDAYNLTLSDIIALKNGEDIAGFKNSELTYLPYSPRSYAYLSDTKFSAKASNLIKGVDILYHESTFMAKDKALAEKTGHSTSVQAAKAAQLSEAKRLIIGHLSPRYEAQDMLNECREIFKNSHLASENMEISI